MQNSLATRRANGSFCSNRLPSRWKPTCLIKSNRSNGGGWMYNRLRQGAKTEILAEMLSACLGGGDRSPDKVAQ
jgi:hypothetical protein